jgi:hypothetical protein
MNGKREPTSESVVTAGEVAPVALAAVWGRARALPARRAWAVNPRAPIAESLDVSYGMLALLCLAFDNLPSQNSFQDCYSFNLNQKVCDGAKRQRPPNSLLQPPPHVAHSERPVWPVLQGYCHRLVFFPYPTPSGRRYRSFPRHVWRSPAKTRVARSRKVCLD